MRLRYRISTLTLSWIALLSAFFLDMFNFVIASVIGTKSYNYSIFGAIAKLSESGVNTDAITSPDKLKEAVEPMYADTIRFFVLLAITIVIILAILILSGATNYHVPQAVLAGVGFILLVCAAGFGSRALGCLLDNAETEEAAKVSLTSLITASGISESNALVALGVGLGAGLNLIKIQVASISYGFYVMMAALVIIFVYSIIAAVKANSDQPVKTHKRHHKEYRRKKPLRKIF